MWLCGVIRDDATAVVARTRPAGLTPRIAPRKSQTSSPRPYANCREYAASAHEVAGKNVVRHRAADSYRPRVAGALPPRRIRGARRRNGGRATRCRSRARATATRRRHEQSPSNVTCARSARFKGSSPTTRRIRSIDLFCSNAGIATRADRGARLALAADGGGQIPSGSSTRCGRLLAGLRERGEGYCSHPHHSSPQGS